MRSSFVALAAVLVCGCGLIDSSGIHVEYSFDPHDFVMNLGQNGAQTVPSVPCTTSPDSCKQMQPPLSIQGATTTLFCDATSQCALQIELRKLLPIDLRNAMTPVPSEAVQFGINVVDLEKLDYWVEAGANTLNVATPPIDLYVAPEAAKDEHDLMATLLGTVSSLPAMSNQCADPADPRPTAAAQGKTVCEAPLSGPGKNALGNYVKNFKTAPFQIIAHTIVTVSAGMPIPSGALDFFIQPTLQLSIIK